MKYWDGTLNDLVKDDKFGGEEVFGDMAEEVSVLLKEKDYTNVIFTTSEDDFENTMLIIGEILPTHRLMVFGSSKLYSFRGLPIVYQYGEGGIVSLFINKENKEKLETLVDKE